LVRCDYAPPAGFFRRHSLTEAARTAVHTRRPRRRTSNAEEASMSTENPYSQYHVVQKGETLSKIAEEYYGDKMLYPKIFEANKDILQDPDKIKPGQRLRIP
jgi:nucleoid-associated protein YgaU